MSRRSILFKCGLFQKRGVMCHKLVLCWAFFFLSGWPVLFQGTAHNICPYVICVEGRVSCRMYLVGTYRLALSGLQSWIHTDCPDCSMMYLVVLPSCFVWSRIHTDCPDCSMMYLVVHPSCLVWSAVSDTHWLPRLFHDVSSGSPILPCLVSGTPLLRSLLHCILYASQISKAPLSKFVFSFDQ